MKKSFARVLSIALAVALVITCAITGLVMPTAANTETQTSTGAQNLLAKDYPFTIEYGNVFNNDSGRNYTLNTTFETGDRYIVRFEAKGAPLSVWVSAGNAGSLKTDASADWHVYQQSVSVNAANVGKNAIWVSWTPDWTNAQEGDTVEVRNLQMYKITSELNLIPDGDMNNGFFSLFKGRQPTAAEQEAGAFIGVTNDPTGGDNKVFQISGTNPYWALGNVLDDYIANGSTIYKLRFRVKGDLRLTLGYTYNRLNNPGSTRDDKGHVYYGSSYGFRTFEFFTCPKSSAFPSYLQFLSVAYGGGKRDLWLDDVELYEVGVAESWTIDETINPVAVAGTVPLANFIKTTPANSYPFGVGTEKDNPANPFTWSLAAGATTVTMSNAANGWLSLPNGNNVTLKAESVTVSDGITTKTAAIDWAYTPRPITNATFNDIIGDMHVWKTQWNANKWPTVAGKGMDGSPAGYVTASTGTVYINQGMYLKPNTKYRFSMLAKATEGTIKVSLSSYKDCTVSNPANYTGDGKWTRMLGYIITGAQPTAHSNSGINISFTAATGATAPEAIIDDVVLEEIDSITEPLLDGGFDVVSGFSKGWGSALSLVDAAQAEGGNIGGNATTVLKVPAGTTSTTASAIPQTYLLPNSKSAMLKAGQAYKITFKHYGGAATLDVVTYLADGVRGGGGTLKCAESTEWKEYSINYVPGASAAGGNDPYRMRLYAKDATADAYFDDFKVEIIKNTVYAPYANQVLGVTTSGNLWLSGYDSVTGAYLSGQHYVAEMSIGTKLYFDFTPNEGTQIPVPSSLKVHYADGTVVPILNTAHDPMTGSQGNRFGPIEVKEGTAYLTFEYAAASTGYQWGTLGSAVRRDVETEEVNGIRFLNRLYMNGLDWANAEGFTVTIDGKEWTVKEIGAIARLSAEDDGELTVDTATKRGLCYSADDQYGTVRVTDYTQRYFDFTVVIPVDAADYDTEYEFGAYMVLTDGTTEETVYTEAMTDSVTAALGRGA